MTILPCIILYIVEINKMNMSLYGSINGVKKVNRDLRMHACSIGGA
jgi:hypothetical protein